MEASLYTTPTVSETVIELLSQEDEIINVLKNENRSSINTFLDPLSLKLLRTFFTPGYDDLNTARALSIYIFKNRASILKKSELNASCKRGKFSNPFKRNNRVTASDVKRQEIQKHTDDNSLVLTKYRFGDYTKGTLRCLKFSKFLDFLFSTSMGTYTSLQQPFRSKRRMDAIIQGPIISEEDKYLPIVLDPSDTDDNNQFRFEVDGENEETNKGQSSLPPIETDETSEPIMVTECPEFSHELHKSIEDVLSEAENYEISGLKEQKRLIKLDVEILKIKKDIESERLKQERLNTQLKMVELEYKKEELDYIVNGVLKR